MTAGFPIPEGRINLLSGAKIQIIGVDFPDKKGGVKSPKDLYQEIATQTENFWTSQSSGNGKFQWNWYPDWVNMPNPIKSYQLGGSFFEGKFNPPAYFNFAENIIAQTDKNIDFTGINFLILVFPQGISNDEIGTFVVHTQGSYRTNEGTIYNLIIAGGDYANYDTYIHEFGHAFGLTDIRDTLDLGNQKQDGMYFDVMNNYIYPELLAWHRFLLGFLLPSQVHCITNKDASTHWLTPVAQQSKNVKAVIIPLSSTRALIVESRRALGYDYKLADRNDLVGAVVYQLDTTIPYHRSPVWVIDILKENQSVINNGYKITNIESGMFGDVIKVEVSR